MRILVADDDSISLKLMRLTLERAGHDVLAFDDGDGLLESCLARPAPVVVTDWLMPRLSGVEMCERLRATPGIPYTHVIVVTTLSSREHTLAAFRAGVDDCMAKPFDADAIVARIGAIERAANRDEELALRQALESFQSHVGHDHAALYPVLGSLVENARRQRAFVRCRAFLRRQIATAESADFSHAEIERLRAELRDLEQIEAEIV